MAKVDNQPHARRRGWLKNGNPPGDPNSAPRCGAKTRGGRPCKGPAMANGRCRMHGGASTGPRTPEGLERARRARWKHGLYSAQAKAARRLACEHLRVARAVLRQLFSDCTDELKGSWTASASPQAHNQTLGEQPDYEPEFLRKRGNTPKPGFLGGTERSVTYGRCKRS